MNHIHKALLMMVLPFLGVVVYALAPTKDALSSTLMLVWAISALVSAVVMLRQGKPDGAIVLNLIDPEAETMGMHLYLSLDELKVADRITLSVDSQ